MNAPSSVASSKETGSRPCRTSCLTCKNNWYLNDYATIESDGILIKSITTRIVLKLCSTHGDSISIYLVISSISLVGSTA